MTQRSFSCIRSRGGQASPLVTFRIGWKRQEPKRKAKAVGPQRVLRKAGKWRLHAAMNLFCFEEAVGLLVLTRGGRQLDVLGAQAGQHYSCPVFLPTAPAPNWVLRSLGEKPSCLQESLPSPEHASAPEKRGHTPGARGLHPWVLSQIEHCNQSPGRPLAEEQTLCAHVRGNINIWMCLSSDTT